MLVESPKEEKKAPPRLTGKREESEPGQDPDPDQGQGQEAGIREEGMYVCTTILLLSFESSKMMELTSVAQIVLKNLTAT